MVEDPAIKILNASIFYLRQSQVGFPTMLEFFLIVLFREFPEGAVEGKTMLVLLL